MYIVLLAEMYVNYLSRSTVIKVNLVWSCETQSSFKTVS